MSAPQSVIRQPGEAETATLGPNQVAFLLGGGDAGGSYSLTAWTMAPPPAPGPPLHIHHDADEAIYVLDGNLECRIDQQSIVLGPGGVTLVPKNTWHTVANAGPGAVQFLVILSPPGFEGYWRESARLLSAQGGPLDTSVVLALQQKYHQETGGEIRRFSAGDTAE